MSKPRIGGVIRELREAKGLTISGLARALKLSAPFISDVEHDRRGFSPEKLTEVTELLGITIDELNIRGQKISDEVKDWIEKHPGLVKLLTHRARSCRCPHCTLLD